MVQQLHHLESRWRQLTCIGSAYHGPLQITTELGSCAIYFHHRATCLATFGEYLFDILTRFQDLVFGFLLALHLIKPKGEASVLRPNGLGIKGLSTMGFP